MRDIFDTLSFCVSSHNSSSRGVPLCVACAAGRLGFPDLATGDRAPDQWVLLPGDGVCLWILPVYLHPHISKCWNNCHPTLKLTIHTKITLLQIIIPLKMIVSVML